VLRLRWLGQVPYDEALAVQHALFAHAHDDYLVLLEHPHVYTLGVRADRSHVLVDPSLVGAEMVEADRGGDVTYHGPGQLVGYPILTVPGHRGGGMADTVAYVRSVEQLVIDVLDDLGLPGAGRLDRRPGVWIDPDGPAPRKIAAIGVRLSRGRSMHGFALNVDPDLGMFGHIVPCGITDLGVTSMRAEGLDVTMREVVDAVSLRAAERWGGGVVDRADVVWRQSTDDRDLSAFSRGLGPGDTVRYVTEGRNADGTSLRLAGRLAEAGVAGGVALAEPKPEWMRAKVRLGDEVLRLKKTIRSLDLTTVCEEAGCPNLSECWSEGTATFMVCGERCTRACGFCLVDTRKPGPLDAGEPARVAEAVANMGLEFAVLTMVARDDLDDGGAAHVAATIDAVRARSPLTRVEALISDLAGSAASLDLVMSARPDVLNHNVETVARLQRAVRPSASYARSLSVLARSKDAGLVTKSGIIVGMGETFDEVVQTLADLASVGVDIVTIGQYLRPTSHHLPVARWWTPTDFDEWRRIGGSLGIAHVESSPFTRSSHHAQSSWAAAISAGPSARAEAASHLGLPASVEAH
jgi:lipoic acid synthetase